MRINFIGNYQAGYVGEIGDATHLVRELEALGHTVRKVPQDIWKASCDGEYDLNWKDKLPVEADFNIVCKWPHFDNEKYVNKLREVSKAPVFYWVWDYMFDKGLPEWHINMAHAADLYLTNEAGIREWYQEYGVSNLYYFPFDVCDGDLPRYQPQQKKYDVVFFGSYLEQGDRIEWLKEINKTNPVKVFSWNYQEWQKEGFDAEPAVYGAEFNQKVAESKICLGFSVNPNCWGYWSNRVGKILTAHGFLLYQYAPGMELFLRDGVEYFSSIEEAREKIDHYLLDNSERERIAQVGWMIGQEHFTSKARVRDLCILAERYILSDNGEGWNY